MFIMEQKLLQSSGISSGHWGIGNTLGRGSETVSGTTNETKEAR